MNKGKLLLIGGASIFLAFVLGAVYFFQKEKNPDATKSQYDNLHPVYEGKNEQGKNSTEKKVETSGAQESSKQDQTASQVEWKTYSNPDVGVSFSYPANLKVVFDDPVETNNSEEEDAGEEGYYWHRIVLKDATAPEQPEFVLEIDSDEDVPVAFDKEYDVEESEDSRVEILSLDGGEAVSEVAKNDGKIILSTVSIDSINEVSYVPRFSFKEGGRDFSSDFQAILKSMKFLELPE